MLYRQSELPASFHVGNVNSLTSDLPICMHNTDHKPFLLRVGKDKTPLPKTSVLSEKADKNL